MAVNWPVAYLLLGLQLQATSAYILNSGYYYKQLPSQSFPLNAPFSSFSPYPRVQDSSFGQFSTCFYFKLNNPTPGNEKVSLFSYLTRDRSSAEVALKNDYIRQAVELNIGGTVGAYFPLLPTTKWTHVCLSWNGLSGEVRAYFDGIPIGTVQGIQPGYRIPNNGILTLGQSQNNFGQMVQVQMWNRVISQLEVLQAQLCQLSGNLVAWEQLMGQSQEDSRLSYLSLCNSSTSTQAVSNGSTVVTEPEKKCLDPDHANAPYNLKEGFEDQIHKEVMATLKDQSIPEMTEVTCCFNIFSKIPRYRIRYFSYEDSYQDAVIAFGYTIKGIFYTISDQTVFEKAYFWRNYHTSCCVTWSGHTGELITYYNNKQGESFSDVSKHVTIPGNGKLKIMQGQYDVWDEANQDNGFIYKIDYFFLWNRTLSMKEMSRFWDCSGSVNDYIVDWGKASWDVNVQDCPLRSEVSPIENQEFSGIKRTVEGRLKYYDDSPIYEMNELSFCFWMYSEKSSLTLIDVITYNDDPFDLLSFGFTKDGILAILLNERVEMAGNFLQAMSWQHFCFTWSGINNGKIQLYVAGNKKHTFDGIAAGSTFAKEGEFYTKNMQYAPPDEQSPTAGFETKITDLNWWNYSLSDDEVSRVYKCSSLVQGNVINSRSAVWLERTCDHRHRDSPFDLKEDIKEGEEIIVRATLRNSDPIPEMSVLTFCLYAPFFYGTPDIPSVFTYEDDHGKPVLSFTRLKANTQLQIGEEIRLSTWTFQGWWWFCVRWSNENGTLEWFTDGKLRNTFEGVATGFVVPANGRIVLQQTQIRPTNASDPLTGFRSKARNFNLWNYSIPEAEMIEEEACMGSYHGNVISWKTSEWDTEKFCPGRSEVSPIENHEFSGIKRTVEGIHYDGSPIYEMNELSFCFWLYSEKSSLTLIDIITYNDYPHDLLSFGFIKDGILAILLNERVEMAGNFLQAMSWQHFCFTWSGINNGKIELYVAGKKEHTVGGIAAGETLAKDGEFYMKNMQYAPPDKQSPTAGFETKITDLNWWNYSLSEDEVIHIYKCSSLVHGNVLNSRSAKWTENTCDHRHRDSPFDLKEDIKEGEEIIVRATLRNSDPIPEMSVLTFCLYAPFFYGTPDIPSVFTYEDDHGKPVLSFTRLKANTQLQIGEEIRLSTWTFQGWWWYCVRWSNENGTLEWFTDGILRNTFEGVATGFVVPANGHIILQQTQIRPTNASDPLTGFRSKARNFNLWNYSISEAEMNEEERCMGSYHGNVISWKTSEWDTEKLPSKVKVIRCMEVKVTSRHIGYPSKVVFNRQAKFSAPEGQQISVYFHSYGLSERDSEHNFCTFDYLEVRTVDVLDGDKYCTKELNEKVLTSNENQMALFFKAYYGTNNGFEV